MIPSRTSIIDCPTRFTWDCINPIPSAPESWHITRSRTFRTAYKTGSYNSSNPSSYTTHRGLHSLTHSTPRVWVLAYNPKQTTGTAHKRTCVHISCNVTSLYHSTHPFHLCMSFSIIQTPKPAINEPEYLFYHHRNCFYTPVIVFSAIIIDSSQNL